MKNRKLRYAVVGLGHIAQVAVLPAFKSSRDSQLVALVSGDPTKRRRLAKRYGVANTYSYDEYDECLHSGQVDVVYITLPNALHREYAVRAAQAGIHVLCEKPLAVRSPDAEAVIRAAKEHSVKLMVAYRLHFDPASLKAIQLASSGRFGEPRYFTSEFGYPLRPENIRMRPEEGGSPLNDIGIYCINAARGIFKAEPTEVFAFAASPDRRFRRTHETVSALLRFPGDRLASFTVSFGSGGISNYRIVGTRGDLFMENAYEYVGEMTQRLTVGEKSREWRFKAGDQFAAELDYFTRCVRTDRDPEPNGAEGLNDVRIIEALNRSIDSGRPVSLVGKLARISARPSVLQRIKKPAHREPKLIRVKAASR